MGLSSLRKNLARAKGVVIHFFALIRREDLQCVDDFSIKAECSLTSSRTGAFPRTILCAKSGSLSAKF
jgi:hypothetical protein